MEFFETLARRRSHRDFSGEPLAKTDLDKILNAAIQAPNHKRNQPWRFTVVEQAHIQEFWQKLEVSFAEAFPGKNPEDIEAKRLKLAAKMPRLGAIVHVTVLADASPHRERENYAAAACAVENMLLAATALGLGSFWSTGEIFSSEICRGVLGIDPTEKFVGSIWFGRATDRPEPPGFDLASCLRRWPR